MESRVPGEWGVPSSPQADMEPAGGFVGPYKNQGKTPDVASLLARQGEYNMFGGQQQQQLPQVVNNNSANGTNNNPQQMTFHQQAKAQNSQLHQHNSCMEDLRKTVAGYDAKQGPEYGRNGVPVGPAPRWVGQSFAVKDELCTPSPASPIFDGHADFGPSGMPFRSGVSFATPGAMAARQPGGGAGQSGLQPPPGASGLNRIASDPGLLPTADSQIENGVWHSIVTTPEGNYMNPSAGPPMAYAVDSWIPWLPQDPHISHGYHDGKFMWYPPKEAPFPDPNPERVLNKGIDQFVQTRRVLKKITWYVPDGVEFQGGVPRVPVKIYGDIPPKPPEATRPKLEHVADPEEDHAVHVDGHDGHGHLPVTAAPVDLKGFRETEEAKDVVKRERAALLQRYQEAAEKNMEVASGCGRALS